MAAAEGEGGNVEIYTTGSQVSKLLDGRLRNACIGLTARVGVDAAITTFINMNLQV